MLQNPYCDANSYSAIPKIHCPLWNSEVHCTVHEGSPLVAVFSQINPVHINAAYVFQIHFNIILYLNHHKSPQKYKKDQQYVRSFSL
jgi:hypothetical protein